MKKPTTAYDKYYSIVSAESWRKKFIYEIENNADIGDPFLDSIESDTPIINDKVRLNNQPARQLINTYPKDELAVARQHYNSKHLVLFLKYYNHLKNRLITSKSINAEFPLFLFKSHDIQKSMEIFPFGIENFQNKSIVNHTKIHRIKTARNNTQPTIFRHRRLDSLLLKLQQLASILKHSNEYTYKLFLREAAEQNSTAWECYKIHYFLDEFLFVNRNGAPSRAPFSGVFTNSNLLELQIFLTYYARSNLALTHRDLESFLENQRQYYLRISVTAPMVDILLLNGRKDLLAYDPEQNIVHMRNAPKEVLESIQKEGINSFGYSKLDGCPFAKMKGVNSNALIEVFRQFDDLALFMLKQTDDFMSLFQPTISRNPNSE